jgi:hypothetical protein
MNRTGPHRRRSSLQRVAVLIAAALVATCVSLSPASATGTFNNSAIADYAIAHFQNGSPGGQCRAWVNAVVKAATGLNIGTGLPDYFAGFEAVGAQRITNVADLRKGDIVQIGRTESSGTPLHTFIIVGPGPNGSTFDVIDSNHDPKNVGKVYRYLRPSVALSDTTRAYRLGSVTGSAGGGSDVFFVKTKNTGSGKVEAFTATAASGYSSGLNTAVPRFSPGDANNGWFGMLPNGDVFFVKTKNTGSGKVEAFTATAASGYSSGLNTAVPRFSPGDANNGWFGIG